MKKDDIQELQISRFNYHLPDHKIAKYPLSQRDRSKLLQYRDGLLSSFTFNELPTLLPEESLLLFNNTRVIHARLLFQKETGAQIEIFCLSPHTPADYAQNFQQRQQCAWNCMIGNAKRWKEEPLFMEVPCGGGVITLKVEKKETTEEEYVVCFSWDREELIFSEVLELAGKLPIPPYLNRPSEAADDETYQTVYSRIEGSVAAPTAGLHFTPDVMEQIHNKGIAAAEVTLHVGAGTFRPVKSNTIAGHTMHTEFITVERETIERLLNNHDKLIVVGTTSLRTVESLYYIGRKLHLHPEASSEELSVKQWEPYDEAGDAVSPTQALQNILSYLDRQGQDRLIADTQIIIVPGYRFQYADAIITNFHQPQSTLLLLIAAFVGDDWEKIYEYALHHDYRFLSYGDSSILWKKSK